MNKDYKLVADMLPPRRCEAPMADVINDFLSGEAGSVRVEGFSNWKSLYSGLKYHIKRRNIPIYVIKRGENVYLARR